MKGTFADKFWVKAFGFVTAFLCLTGCGQGAPSASDGDVDQAAAEGAETEQVVPRFSGVDLVMPPDTVNANPESNARRNAYFGDLQYTQITPLTLLRSVRSRRLMMLTASLRVRPSSIQQDLMCNYKHRWTFMR